MILVNKKQKKRKEEEVGERGKVDKGVLLDRSLKRGRKKRKTGKRERKSVPNKNRPSILSPAPH